MTMAARLVLNSVSKRFGPTLAVDQVSACAADGEFLALLGPSGCGKTTLLRLIAGFLVPDAGRIVSRGQDITVLPPYRRSFGVVFQNYALFPHMTVLENVGYGLKVRGRPKAEIAAVARRALDRVGLCGAEERFPGQISGGQQQRVALARAIVIEPDLLLLDEPLSALDKSLREEMQVELRQLQRRIGITTIFVTHDQEEALTLADRIAVMRAGRILQMGAPQTVYDRPNSEFVATFLGTTNLLSGRIRRIAGDIADVLLEGTAMRAARHGLGLAPGAPVRIAVRPENVRISGGGEGLKATVRDILFQGHRLIVLLETAGGAELRAFAAPGEWQFPKGSAVVASWTESGASVFAGDPATLS